jgi:hypothetical protein
LGDLGDDTVDNLGWSTLVSSKLQDLGYKEYHKLLIVLVGGQQS